MDRRFKVFVPVEAVIQDAPSRVHVLDISVSGAKVHIGKNIGRQGFADLNLLGECSPTRIVWAAGGRMGLRVLKNLALSQVDELIGGSKPD